MEHRPPAPTTPTAPVAPPPCQGCAMPLRSDAERGTEADGSASGDHRHFRCGDGAFTDPDLTLDRQTAKLVAMAVARGTPEGEAREVAERVLLRVGRS